MKKIHLKQMIKRNNDYNSNRMNLRMKSDRQYSYTIAMVNQHLFISFQILSML